MKNQKDEKGGILPQHRDQLSEMNRNIISHLDAFDARAALASARRLQAEFENIDLTITASHLEKCYVEIKGRLFDEISEVRLFVMAGHRTNLLDGPSSVLSEEVLRMYPSVRFEIDEALRCLAFDRHTASVFHNARALEIIIKAILRRLKIDEPSKSAERNWGRMLATVKAALDEQFPMASRKHGEIGAVMAEIYALLEAARGPWRNAVMHVEAIYSEEDARHILDCTVQLLRKMAPHFDEDGEPPLV
jgi:hypothetical protein